MEAKLTEMRPRLQASSEIFEFLEIMQTAPILPPLLRPAQRLMVGAAVDILPIWVRHLLGLGQPWHLRPWQRVALKRAGLAADRLRLDSSPAARASIRLGLPSDYLWKAAATSASMRASSPS